MTAARKRRSLVAVMFAMCTMLIGNAMFASASDTATSQGSSYTSNEFQPQDVQIAVVHDGDCSNATYSDGPVPEWLDSRSINLNTSGDVDPIDSLCIKNAGDYDGEVHLSFVNVVNTEIGDCSDPEARVDDTCTDGDLGELSHVLSIQPNSGFSGGSGYCAASTTAFDSFSDVDLGVLHAGETCDVELFALDSIGTTNNDLLAASTDKVTWDTDVTLEAAS